MDFTPPNIDLTVLGIPAFLMAWGMVVLLIDLFTSDRRVLATVSLLGLVGAAGVGFLGWNYNKSAFSGMMVVDNLSIVVNWVLLGATALTILMALDYLPEQGLFRGEFFPLLLFAASGMTLLVQSTDLVTLFVAVELLSVSLYVLTGFAVPRIRSGEAAIKYLLLGAFAAGFLVYGIALIYGFVDVAPAESGLSSTSFQWIAQNIQTKGEAALTNPVLLTGLGFVMIALGFKVSLVPFHSWTPDVYEGAPTPVTAFMSVATKGAAFLAILRVLNTFGAMQSQWLMIFAVLAAVTMLYGNIVAVAQTNLKRMLAYSSIAHAGYMLMGILPLTQLGVSAFVIYLISYTLTNLGAFAVVAALEKRGVESFELNDLRGLGRQQPLLAVLMVLFMFSLAGIPLTAGFMGKFAVFQAAWAAGLDWLVIVGVITSAISAFFYLRITVLMFMREAEGEERAALSSGSLTAGLVLAAIGILLLGIIPTPLLDAMKAMFLQ